MLLYAEEWREKVNQATVTSRKHKTVCSQCLHFNAGYIRAVKSPLSKVTGSLITMAGCVNFWGLNNLTCDLCLQRTVEILLTDTYMVYQPYKEQCTHHLSDFNILKISGVILLDSLYFNFFLSLFKEDTVWTYLSLQKVYGFLILDSFDLPKERLLFFKRIEAQWIRVITVEVPLIHSL